METKKDFNDWFETSPLKETSDREAMKIAWEKGAESIKNSVLELLLMGDK